MLWILLILGASSFGIAKIGSEVLEGETQAFDFAVLRAFRRPNDPGKLIGPEWIERATIDLTSLGGASVILVIVLSSVAYCLLARKRSAALTILISSVGALALNSVLKGIFDRARPSVVPALASASSNAFPSGHAALSASVYLTMAAVLMPAAPGAGARRCIGASGILITLLVGTTRILLGVHYPTDVLAGWMLGCSWSIACTSVARRWTTRKRTPLRGT